MKLIYKIIIIIITVFVLLSFIPFDRSNKPSLAEINAPDEVKFILKRSCYDCHSYETKHPLYSYVFPISILINHHINEGREELNFSEFESLTISKQSSKLRSIVEEIEENEMPLFGYTVIHRDAILSPEEKEVLITWAKSRGGDSEDDDN
jgi:hypothetical protein